MAFNKYYKVPKLAGYVNLRFGYPYQKNFSFVQLSMLSVISIPTCRLAIHFRCFNLVFKTHIPSVLNYSVGDNSRYTYVWKIYGTRVTLKTVPIRFSKEVERPIFNYRDIFLTGAYKAV